MPLSFKNPEPSYKLNVTKEKTAISKHYTHRAVPKSPKKYLLLSSWNIANLGKQKRSNRALELIAHILKRFDFIAVQEVYDDNKNFLTYCFLLISIPYNLILSPHLFNFLLHLHL